MVAIKAPKATDAHTPTLSADVEFDKWWLMNGAYFGGYLATGRSWFREGCNLLWRREGGHIIRHKSGLKKQVNQCSLCVLVHVSFVTTTRLSAANKMGRFPAVPPPGMLLQHQSNQFVTNNPIHLHDGGIIIYLSVKRSRQKRLTWPPSNECPVKEIREKMQFANDGKWKLNLMQ